MKDPAQDYECVDISGLCNTTFDILFDYDESDARVGYADLAWRGHIFGSPATAKTVPRDLQYFRGILFFIGSKEDDPSNSRLIKMDSASPRISIPLNTKATNVIFAHRLLKTKSSERIGSNVADYTFNLENGKSFETLIRTQVEIDQVPGNALGAFSDHQVSLFPRDAGKFNQSGRRQTGIESLETQF